MFYYEENNPLKDNFPDVLDTPFLQIPKINLIQNPQGRTELSTGRLATFLKNDIYHNNLYQISDANFKNHVENILPNLANAEGRNVNEVFWPDGGWSYINLDARYRDMNITAGNKPSVNSVAKYKQYSTDQVVDGTILDDSKELYTGFLGYHSPFIGGFNLMNGYVNSPTGGEVLASTSYEFEWAKWIIDSECFSFNKCLQFSGSTKWDTMDFYDNLTLFPPGSGDSVGDEETQTTSLIGYVDEFPGAYAGNGTNYSSVDYFYDEVIGMFGDGKFPENQYRTLNQAQIIQDVENINPYSSMKVSFYMKTLEAPNQEKGFPAIQIGLRKGDNLMKQGNGATLLTSFYDLGESELVNTNNSGYNVFNARYNSVKDTNNNYTEADGSIVTFQNS